MSNATAEKKLTKDERIVMAVCKNAALENRGACVIVANEKRGARKLEAAGLVTIKVTAEKCAGLAVWDVKLVA